MLQDSPSISAKQQQQQQQERFPNWKNTLSVITVDCSDAGEFIRTRAFRLITRTGRVNNVEKHKSNYLLIKSQLSAKTFARPPAPRVPERTAGWFFITNIVTVTEANVTGNCYHVQVWVLTSLAFPNVPVKYRNETMTKCRYYSSVLVQLNILAYRTIICLTAMSALFAQTVFWSIVRGRICLKATQTQRWQTSSLKLD